MIERLQIGVILVLIAGGLFFTFVSAVGVIRLPDIYSRSHTASQADTLGAGMVLAGVALALGWESATVKTVLLLFFIFVTNPTAAHAITRAAHEEGIEPWTVDDDRTDAELAADADRISRGNDRSPGSRTGSNLRSDGGERTDGSRSTSEVPSDGGERSEGSRAASDLQSDGGERTGGPRTSEDERSESSGSERSRSDREPRRTKFDGGERTDSSRAASNRRFGGGDDR